MSFDVVETAIKISSSRMNTPSLDLLQFHWWEYSNADYITALRHLGTLRDAGKLKHIGLTNFDTQRLKLIHEAGVNIAINQVQYSIIDRRPEVAMVPYCLESGVFLTAYGVLCGGLLTDRYRAKPEPTKQELDTASLRKYKNMIDTWGGWILFQALLEDLHKIAAKHRVSIANVATRFVIEKPVVAGVIIGARLGRSDNHIENLKVFTFELDDSDRNIINSYSKKSRNLFEIIGDCGDEYRG